MNKSILKVGVSASSRRLISIVDKSTGEKVTPESIVFGEDDVSITFDGVVDLSNYEVVLSRPSLMGV